MLLQKREGYYYRYSNIQLNLFTRLLESVIRESELSVFLYKITGYHSVNFPKPQHHSDRRLSTGFASAALTD
jgi:hypothetical protein